VSETPVGVSEIVRKDAGEPKGPAARSDFAPRFTKVSDIGEPEDDCFMGGIWAAPVERSRPIANCAAPEISKSAIAPVTPDVIPDISCPAVRGQLANLQRARIHKGFSKRATAAQKMWQSANLKKSAQGAIKSGTIFLPARLLRSRLSPLPH
jgi:hypothetical protein